MLDAAADDDVGSPWPPQLMERYNLVPQGISAEMIADKWEIPRSELDEIGLRSHQNAHRATEEGRFEREIVPLSVNGDTYVTDQGIRPDTNLEALSQLKPAFKEDGKVTAGNSSQISDGAAAVLLMERVNVNGGAIALGHPLGSTGARLITTLVHELERSDKEVGLVTMCCGGGLGTGTLIQRL